MKAAARRGLRSTPTVVEVAFANYVEYARLLSEEQASAVRPMEGRVRVATNLKRLRIGRGTSQEALAVDAGVDRTYVSGIERQEFNPTIDLLQRLADALGVDISILFAPIEVGAAAPRPLKRGRRPRA